MGQWTLERLTTHSSPLDGNIFGTNFHAIFHLKYTTSTLSLLGRLVFIACATLLPVW